VDRGAFTDDADCARAEAAARAMRDVSRLVIAADLQQQIGTKLRQLVQ
jgi:hypothetical protein